MSKAKNIRKIGGRSIGDRAEKINIREELGHGEIDTVVGMKGCALVLVERKSRKQIIEKTRKKRL